MAKNRRKRSLLRRHAAHGAMLSGASLAILAFACGACGGGSAPVGGPGGNSGSAGAWDAGERRVDANDIVGTFTVQLGPDAIKVDGAVYDGPTPPSPTLIHGVTTASSGDCQLVPMVSPICGACDRSSAVCVATDKCQPYPSMQSVGAIQVSGIRTATGEAQFTMTPRDGNYSDRISGVSLPFPGAFDEGDTIALTAAGNSSVSAFTLKAPAIAPLHVAETTIQLAREVPVLLHWSPAGQPGASTVTAVIDITSHGGTLAQILCDSKDDGFVQIDGPLVSGLMDFGYFGGNVAVLTRHSVDRASISSGGMVELDIYSQVQVHIAIEGQTGCDEKTPCPSGKTCTLYQCL